MDRYEKAAEEIAHRAADFLNREANRNILITVTRAESSSDGHKVNIFVSVYPEEGEQNALIFLKRKRSELREFLKKSTRINHIPTLDFLIDYGEKNRDHLDKLSEA